jgi:hypothetical protein
MNQLLTLRALPVMLVRLVCNVSVRRLAYVRASLLLFSGVAILLVAGCAHQADSAPAITVEHAISPELPKVGPATITLKLADAAAKPVSGARITLEADMSHPGMAPVFGEASETEPGKYQAHLKFAMAGDWVVLLHVRLPGGQTLERQFDVSRVLPN